MLFQWGALDFAGGTVVHINAGIAGLVGCLIIGKRTGYPREPMPPHSLTMTMIGASLLWVGWFGFNAGSNLEANGVTGVAFINTFVATAAAGRLLAARRAGHPRASRRCSARVTGAVAGLVAVTPAAGFAGPMGSIILGLIVSPICFFFVTTVKSKLGYDDSLDVFGVHCIGGIIGALATGILVAPALGGQGVADYLAQPGTIQFTYLGYGRAAVDPAQGGGLHPALVGHRLRHPVLRDRQDAGPAPLARSRARRPRHRRAWRARLPLLTELGRRGREPPRRPDDVPPANDWAGEATRRPFFDSRGGAKDARQEDRQ